jgi:transposase, IS30 family
MGRCYEQMSLRERSQLELLLEEGWTLRAIAVRLGRAASTISRELRRNGQAKAKRAGVYLAEAAQTRAASRRRLDARFRLARQPDLRARVKDGLAMGWSPAQIAGRLAREQGSCVISHESIYRYIYHRVELRDYWHRLLPRRRQRRGSGRRGGHKTIARRVSIHARSPAATRRAEPGHWEADLMMFARPRQSLLVVHERMSRMTLLAPLDGKQAEQVAAAIARLIAPLPEKLLRSMAFDNGPEFYRHYRLTDRFGLQGYFCDAHAPWQKGGVENLIGRLRRYLPRKTDLAACSKRQILSLQNKLNATPRKCLDFQTPDEAFYELLKSVALQT